MGAILNQLRHNGVQIKDEDVARLSEYINVLGRYSFAMPDSVIRGELRPLCNPAIEDSQSYFHCIYPTSFEWLTIEA